MRKNRIRITSHLHKYDHIPLRPKLLQKILFKQKCFGTTNCVKITKQSLYRANSFAGSLANRDKPVAATLQRKCSCGIIFVTITKIITKIIVPRNYFVRCQIPWPFFSRELCRKTHIVGANLKEDSEDFHSKRGEKIAEKRPLNRRQ